MSFNEIRLFWKRKKGLRGRCPQRKLPITGRKRAHKPSSWLRAFAVSMRIRQCNYCVPTSNCFQGYDSEVSVTHWPFVELTELCHIPHTIYVIIINCLSFSFACTKLKLTTNEQLINGIIIKSLFIDFVPDNFTMEETVGGGAVKPIMAIGHCLWSKWKFPKNKKNKTDEARGQLNNYSMSPFGVFHCQSN